MMRARGCVATPDQLQMFGRYPQMLIACMWLACASKLPPSALLPLAGTCHSGVMLAVATCKYGAEAHAVTHAGLGVGSEQTHSRGGPCSCLPSHPAGGQRPACMRMLRPSMARCA
eukprot:336484-Chlamydomonas_euryale.AAC.2